MGTRWTWILWFGAIACSNGAAPLAEVTPEARIARGKQVYRSSCISCHNPDPAKDGVLGPAVAGSSAELLEARVVKAAYPPGYIPKRNTKIMMALPHLTPELGALHAFLNAGVAQ